MITLLPPERFRDIIYQLGRRDGGSKSIFYSYIYNENGDANGRR